MGLIVRTVIHANRAKTIAVQLFYTFVEDKYCSKSWLIERYTYIPEIEYFIERRFFALFETIAKFSSFWWPLSKSESDNKELMIHLKEKSKTSSIYLYIRSVCFLSSFFSLKGFSSTLIEVFSSQIFFEAKFWPWQKSDFFHLQNVIYRQSNLFLAITIEVLLLTFVKHQLLVKKSFTQ